VGVRTFNVISIPIFLDLVRFNDQTDVTKKRICRIFFVLAKYLYIIVASMLSYFVFFFFFFFFFLFVVEKIDSILKSVPKNVPTVSDKKRHTIDDHLGFGDDMFRYMLSIVVRWLCY
jgi:hypothetical protein